MKKMKVGVIGCGNISKAYFNAMKTFRMSEIIACADIKEEAAKAKAEEYSVKAMSVDGLLADKSIEAVINLTIPAVHAEVDRKILNAGKHVHSEKPLGITLDEGRKVVELAKKKNLRIGCAPDTFMGAGGQTCRKLIDDGWIGRPVSGIVSFLGKGPEGWHPNPAFFYQKGGGPMLDLGPYYMTALVNLLGPVKKVCAMTTMAWKERLDTHPDHFGAKLPVDVPTHYAGVLEMQNGAIITVTVSFDIKCGHGHNPIEIYGTEGTLAVPDPNTFGGPVRLRKMKDTEWKEVPLSHSYDTNMRGIGLADMVCGIEQKRPHRCCGELALHVLEVMLSFEEASKTGKHVTIKSKCAQPAPLPTGLPEGMLD
ncbi:MAG: oxidoreductase [Lentisphaerae bacterium GWF2_44_16]|nr:MAG: oxidoreductase [Lentisphaerae bacterium GWF2_44_16]